MTEVNMEKFLKSKLDENDKEYGVVTYCESVNDDALSDTWLYNDTSYIWKIGILTVIDSNKCDWVKVLIAHEREPGIIDFIGQLYYRDGENDDIGRSLARYMRILEHVHPVFEAS